MDPQLRQLLLSADHATGCEWPSKAYPQSTITRLRARIGLVHEQLRTQHGLVLDRDSHIEDASFCDQLTVWAPTDEKERRWGCVAFAELGIRFSNFGDLFTVYTGAEEFPGHYDVPAIIRLIETHGFVFVPPDPLHVPYDGLNDRLRSQGITWWIRYFDYL